MSRQQKTWLVTGCSSGLGRAIAEEVLASGNRVVVIAREGDDEIIRALDIASGKEMWRAVYPAPFTVNPAAQLHGPGPKSTPAIVDGRVFTFGIGGVLSAFDLAGGKLIWRVPAPSVPPQYGTATSPLIDGTSIIAHVGGDENGSAERRAPQRRLPQSRPGEVGSATVASATTHPRPYQLTHP